MPKEPKHTLYDTVFERVFFSKYRQNPTITDIAFSKDDIVNAADQFGIAIRNVPDIIYTYRARRELPASVVATGNWIVKPAGKGRYTFTQISRSPFVTIQEGLAAIDVLNATPEIVEKYNASLQVVDPALTGSTLLTERMNIDSGQISRKNHAGSTHLQADC